MAPKSTLMLIIIIIYLHLTILVRFINTVEQQQQPHNFLWKQMVDVSSDTFNKAFIPPYVDIENDVLAKDSIVSDNCKSDIKLAIKATTLRQTWAVKLFNSWAKFPPSGILRGTLTDFGDYDQCHDVQTPIEAQYCLVNVKLPMPQPMPKFHNYYQKSKVLPDWDEMRLLSPLEKNEFLSNGTIYRTMAESSSVFYYVYIQMGICLPQRCTNEDITSISNASANKLGLTVGKFTCESKQTNNYDFVQWSAIFMLTLVVTLAIIATIYDRICEPKTTSATTGQVLLWFSPMRNIHKLVCTKSSDDLTVVHGLRFVTIVWIIIAHTLEWNNLNIFRDTFTIRDKLSDTSKQPLYKGHYSVDTFFYLSGLLTSYVTIRYTNGDYRNFKSFSFLVLRYLRLTPQLAAFLLLTSLLPPMFDGPLWKSYMSKLTDRCYNTWWHSMVYLQNMIDIENICAVHTWYLAADMQLHWLSLIPIVILLRNRSQGIVFTKVLILVCVCISCITIFTQQLPPGSVITSKNNFLDEDGKPTAYISFFYKPWNHVNVFFIGFIFGAILQDSHRKQIILSKMSKYLLWLVAFGGYLFCIYSTMPWLYGRPYDPLWSAVLFPLNRTIWALVLTLVIWLCITNNGSAIGRFLSWPGFRPLSRMTYSVYLTHSWVLWVALGTRRELIDLNARSLTLLCAGVILVSYVIGFIFTVAFETPLIHALEYIKRKWLEPSQCKSVITLEIEQEKELRLLEIKYSN